MDKQRIKEALDKAYDEAVSNLFKTLVANLIDASQGGIHMTDEIAVGYYSRGLRFVQRAFDRAKELADKPQSAPREKAGS